MMWRIDPELKAAEQLPDWARFHRCCGERGLCFDHVEKKGGAFRCTAFRPEPTPAGGWAAVHLADGAGKSVLDALADALAKSGVAVPEAEALLCRGLAGDPEKFVPLPTPLTAPEKFDSFDALIEGDSFDALI